MRLEARTVAPPSVDAVKMEDRKRPIADDAAPPAKRQAVTVNGARSHPDTDLPWKDDIEAYQKDAILRSMRELKREKATLEALLSDVEKRSRHHDDHLRTMDAWFDQCIDEIKIRSTEQLPALSGDASNASSIPPSLFFEDSDNLKKHLTERKEKILSSLTTLFARYSPDSPQTADLQQQLSKHLAEEKDRIVQLQRLTIEKEQLSDRLDMATHRYLVAEKKIDRIKSHQVQKLEQQAVASSTVKEEALPVSNGAGNVTGESVVLINEETEAARDQAVAEVARRKEQLDQLAQENKTLTEEISALKIKLAGLCDDDYAKTDLFKALKMQHEDVIKRINNLEETNNQLREEAQKYQAERTAYRIKIDEESRAALAESESNISQAEANLARIRSARDDLMAKNSVLEYSHKDSHTSAQQSKELVSACESRIAALEAACDRLRLQLPSQQQDTEVESSPGTEGQTVEQLRKKIANLESQLALLNKEIPSMELAFRDAKAVSSKKIAEIATWEESITKAHADKAKADQKFFAAMKTKGELEQQVRVLRTQATKSTEVVAQLKEADSLSRSLVEKAEKQLAEVKTQLDDLSTQHRQLQQKVSENAIASEGQVSQIAELKKIVEAKDASFLAAKQSLRETETERDKLTVQVGGLEKQVQLYRKKSQGVQTSEVTMMETMIRCQICRNSIRDTAIKTCGHTFCENCVQDRLTNRSRKCPTCGKAFGSSDIMRVHF